MNIAIVDDNGTFLELFNSIISKACERNNIEYKIVTFYEGLSLLDDFANFHLIFLDIEMPVINGIEVAEKINSLKGANDFPYIVFVTCNDSLVFKALRSYPYSFIRKSDLENDMETCILKIQEKITANSSKYCIKGARKRVLINLKDVLYLEKDKNYIQYHTESEVLKERGTMDEKEIELAQNGFIRTHVGYIVNIKHIAELKLNEIVLDNSEVIPVSKRYRSLLEENYYKWLVDLYD